MIIELDGIIHKFQKNKDKKREEELKNLGYAILRFDNEEILNELFNVERTLKSFVDEFEERMNNK